MTTVTPLFADGLSPTQLRVKQDDAMLIARRWLTPAQLAAVLLNRSRDDLWDALDELLQAADDLITYWIEDGDMNAWDRDKVTRVNAQKALCVLIDHFGIETIREYIDVEYGTPDDAA